MNDGKSPQPKLNQNVTSLRVHDLEPNIRSSSTRSGMSVTCFRSYMGLAHKLGQTKTMNWLLVRGMYARVSYQVLGKACLMIDNRIQVLRVVYIVGVTYQSNESFNKLDRFCRWSTVAEEDLRVIRAQEIGFRKGDGEGFKENTPARNSNAYTKSFGISHRCNISCVQYAIDMELSEDYKQCED
ncbi:hypothetical protein BYT27DRAFT_7257591 [Phlegmacium glaucopus]|nr:hypothetical protein BYT27DRAFT_7257591 [Phlegmacium glaucopus]